MESKVSGNLTNFIRGGFTDKVCSEEQGDLAVFLGEAKTCIWLYTVYNLGSYKKKIRRPGFYNPYVADILEIFLTTKDN